MSVGLTFPDDPFEHVRRQMEQMQRIADAMSPLTQRLIRDEERWRRLMNPPTERIIRDQQVLQDAFQAGFAHLGSSDTDHGFGDVKPVDGLAITCQRD